MKVDPVAVSEFSESVMAVPPLARRTDLTLAPEQNRVLVRHIEAGGIRTLLYGGNANLYHVAVSEYQELLDMLAESAGPQTRVIPAIGPDYGKMLDQARILAQTQYRTAMVLPLAGFTTPRGVADGLKRLCDIAGMPFTLYIKSEDYIDVDTLAALVADGTLLAVKYAIVRADPSDDPYLRRLLQSVPASQVVSGMGERPSLIHIRNFGLATWTTGSGCIAPHAVMALLRAARSADCGPARLIHERFLPLETLRDDISLIRVLHDAVTLSGIADMGPILPLLSATPEHALPAVESEARALLAFDRSVVNGVTA
ncbi:MULTISPECIES: dihydrodipicolinate synthase family protein [unclassified Caballeronia]|uniref:dihydrodipicolinate synthase family protein n=1 Tax=unclassified Caballeronia TaxID=2646786 RepID=UPI002861871E|nr:MULTISPECIES: dihydrodipicolinate synthase family protein [unclassified Caballeronia]MDR5739579.1 dihydrodipicolinate synthase family protein [Caballeronia sp. LZ016]MDR5808046.1 dihydrodipicolinate synthase family protein [Caballeronia sp. LZ019]